MKYLLKGGLCTEVVSVLSHLDIIIMWSLHRGGLCTEVVFGRWSLIKGFTLAFICIKFDHFHFPFLVSNSLHCFQLPMRVLPMCVCQL